MPTDELEGYRRPSRRTISLMIAGVVCVLAIVAYLAIKPAGEQPVPEFELPLLDGGEMSSAELHGSPVVVNFFASWCPPCREEAPVLERAWQRHRDEGVRFVGVDIQDTTSDARRFVRELGITFPVVRDAERRFARGLDVYGLPQTFFIDEGWNLLGVEAGERITDPGGDRPVQLGAIDEKELEEQIDRLLQEAARE